ncbi:hypothetical protein ACK3TF_006041 [Chlorella vulgaris]
MRVLCLDKASKAVLSTHESLAAAATSAGATGGAGNIQRCCVGKSKSAYGYCWAYEVLEKPDLVGEEWRPFKNILVSNCGRVRQETSAGLMTRDVTDFSTKSGYREIMVDNERWPIQRLVYHVFRGIPKGSNVYFKDGDTGNPRLENLEVKGGPVDEASMSWPPLDLSYVAGFFDGDGSINVSKVGYSGKQGYLLKAEFSQCNKGFLERLGQQFGTGKMYKDVRPDKYAGEANYCLRFCGAAARPLLDVLARLAIVKAPQAALALTFLDLPRVGSGDEKEQIRLKMRDLNADKTYTKQYSRLTAGYVAGLFDAEGNVYTGAPPKNRMYVKITQVSDPELLHQIVKLLGFGVVSEGCRWKIYSKGDIRAFHCLTRHFLHIKREKLDRLVSSFD